MKKRAGCNPTMTFTGYLCYRLGKGAQFLERNVITVSHGRPTYDPGVTCGLASPSEWPARTFSPKVKINT